MEPYVVSCSHKTINSDVRKSIGPSAMFRPGRAYGTPDAGNGRNGLAESYFFVLETDSPIFRISGPLPPEQFDYLAERLGTPKLAEMRRG